MAALPEPVDLTTTSRVAVVMPAYQAARWIAATLDSVAAQTEPDLEVIVVDDGSDDGTADLAATFADRIPGMSVIRQEQQGPASARNRGLEEVRSRYVCFLDADDLLAPEALRQQADHLDEHPDLALVHSDVLEFEDADDGTPRILRRCPPPESPLHERLLEGSYGCLPSASLQTRQSALAVGGYVPDFRSSEDLDFLIRLAFAGFRMAHVPTPPLLYRIHAGQRSSDRLLNRGEMLRALEHLLARMPDAHPRRAKLLDRIRFLRLIQAGALDAAGRTREARRLLAKTVSFPPRPGHLLEALRLLPRPSRVLDWIGHPPESAPRGN